MHSAQRDAPCAVVGVAMPPGVRVPVLAAVVEHKDPNKIDQQSQH